MGRLTYGSEAFIDLDDRTLAHLQVVVAAKFRRGESFVFSWRADPASGLGRLSIGLHPARSVGFSYTSRRRPELNPVWIDALKRSADSPGGLQLVPEPPVGASDPISPGTPAAPR